MFVDPTKVTQSCYEFGTIFPSWTILPELGEKEGYKLRKLSNCFQENSNTKEKIG